MHSNLIRPILFAAMAGLCWPAMAQIKMTLGYAPANFSMAAFVAKDQGFFAKRGLDVTLQMIPILQTIPGAIVSGSLQVGVLTPPSLLLADEGGLDLLLVAGGATQTKAHPVGGVSVSDKSGIKSPTDFHGKKVGVPGLNAMAHIVFQKWLKQRGADPRKVTYIEVSFPQMADMLKSGTIDAALAVEPFLSRIEGSKSGHLVSNFQVEVMDGHIEIFYVMPKQFIQKNPSAPAAFKEAIREGIEWIANNTELARKTQITYLKLPEQVAMTVKLPIFTVDVTRADMQFWVDLCKEFGLTKGTVTVDQVLWRP
jgi:NitT/TauT family transport system substrate-binding protein